MAPLRGSGAARPSGCASRDCCISLAAFYRGEVSADPAMMVAEVSADQRPAGAEPQQPGAEVLAKRAQAERAYAELSADGTPVSAGQLAAAVGLSASYARALIAEFQARPPATGHANGRSRTPVSFQAHP